MFLFPERGRELSDESSAAYRQKSFEFCHTSMHKYIVSWNSEMGLITAETMNILVYYQQPIDSILDL